jgi:hypothetical protein
MVVAGEHADGPWTWPSSSALTGSSHQRHAPSRCTTVHSGTTCETGDENAGAGTAGDGRSAGTGAYFARTSRNAQYLAVGFPASSSGAS